MGRPALCEYVPLSLVGIEGGCVPRGRTTSVIVDADMALWCAAM
jgi:hypothetical protein